MTATQSFLSNPPYRYDCVVAVTQRSINNAMTAFLDSLTLPAVTCCFIADQNGNPVPIDHAALVRLTKGTDPFSVPDSAEPGQSAALQNLRDGRFMVGFQAKLGLPPGYLDANDRPPLVELGNDTASVAFNLLCSEFTIVELNPGDSWSALPTWTRVSQQPGAAWIFQSKVDLRLSLVERGAYAALPPDIQKAIMNLGGGGFSIRQLLFDFSNAGLAARRPALDGTKLTTKVKMLLEQYFLGEYFATLQKQGQPMLGVSVSPNTISLSTLTLTGMDFAVNPYYGVNRQPILQPNLAQRERATLNYLCAADGHSLPPRTRFEWNWIDADEPGDYDGVVVINRITFANYFRNQLQHYVEQNCLRPGTRVWLSGVFNLDVNFQSTMTPGQQPTVTMPPAGETVLSFAYTAEAFDQAGLNGALGSERLRSNFNLDVRFAGNTVTIVQRLTIYMEGTGLFGVRSAGNIVDKVITDTYTLVISANGDLSNSLHSGHEDFSQNLSQNGFVNFWAGDINRITSTVTDWARNFASRQFGDIPLSGLRKFVFPGGRAFSYRTVGFSDHQDLVAHINYLDGR